jgi:hypothetical protein
VSVCVREIERERRTCVLTPPPLVGMRSVLAVNLQLRPPALSNYQLTPLGSAGGMPGHRDLVHARGGSENQGGGPGGPCTGTGVSSPGG